MGRGVANLSLPARSPAATGTNQEERERAGGVCGGAGISLRQGALPEMPTGQAMHEQARTGQDSGPDGWAGAAGRGGGKDEDGRRQEGIQEEEADGRTAAWGHADASRATAVPRLRSGASAES